MPRAAPRNRPSRRPWRWLTSEGLAVHRLVASAAAGGVAAAAASVIGAPWTLVVLAGWNTAAVVFLVSVWATVLRFSPTQTHAMATKEDASRGLSTTLLLAASSASLVGVVFGLYRVNRVDGSLRVWLTAAVIGGVVGSWAVVHTVYVLRYAHLYYGSPPGAISFPGDEEPNYTDFAYLAFTLGMTFQVSDNCLRTRAVRRVALGHCLLSYLFSTVIVATTINVVAGLVG